MHYITHMYKYEKQAYFKGEINYKLYHKNST